MSQDEFYMVLPSNACATNHPNNSASDYIVTWENPIELDSADRWKVAMTELSYIYRPTTISSNYAFKYSIERPSKEFEKIPVYIHVETENENHMIAVTKIRDRYWTFDYFEIGEYNGHHLNIKSDYKFRIYNEEPFNGKFSFASTDYVYPTTFPGTDIWTFESNITHSELCAEAEANGCYFGPIYFDIFDGSEHVDEVFYFAEDIDFTTDNDLVQYMKNRFCPNLFENITYSEYDKKLSLVPSKQMSRLEMMNGLNFVLGFQNSIFKFSKKQDVTLESDGGIQLKRGIVNLYVYASICSSIYVGETKVPLLKNVFIDSSNDLNKEGHARNYVVYHPMYIPVSSAMFNSIEVNVRNDAGFLMHFPKGSVTVLTLHFKKD